MSYGKMMPRSLKKIIYVLLSVLHGTSKLCAATIAAK
jgi:hypothetical protein